MLGLPKAIKGGHRGPSCSLVESPIESLIRNPCPLFVWQISTAAHMRYGFTIANW